MTRITIEIDNEAERNLLEELLQRMNITYSTSREQEQDLLNIIDQGGDGGSLSDPVAWQQEVRKDRELPFHNS